ncbi:MAG: biotin/lipoyl-binding protein [Victivallaceae bacterium]|nr:biotin/lipoyl-binding protein [Victivallaceae bacterium]
MRAQVVQIAARVSGPIIKLPIADNQFVKTGDLLFEIKPSVFIAELKQAQAELKKPKDDIKSLEKQVGASQANVKMFTANIQQTKMALKKAGCCSTCT